MFCYCLVLNRSKTDCGLVTAFSKAWSCSSMFCVRSTSCITTKWMYRYVYNQTCHLPYELHLSQTAFYSGVSGWNFYLQFDAYLYEFYFPIVLSLLINIHYCKLHYCCFCAFFALKSFFGRSVYFNNLIRIKTD